MKKDLLRVVAQAFYGNKTTTEIRKENLDKFILGILDDFVDKTRKIDRTIIKIPNTENVVMVYNKYQEEEKLSYKDKLKPLAFIPEQGIEIYSRCIVCRMDENGELESLHKEDFEKVMKYLAD